MIPIRVIPQRCLDPHSKAYRPGLGPYVPGGIYLTPDGMDATETRPAGGVVDVLQRDILTISTELSVHTGTGLLVRTNLFRKTAGWRWNGEILYPDLSNLVSVATSNDHIFCIRAVFQGGLRLARYAEAVSEPRLRPTARGRVIRGPQIGEILVRRRVRPLFGQVVIDGGPD